MIKRLSGYLFVFHIPSVHCIEISSTNILQLKPLKPEYVSSVIKIKAKSNISMKTAWVLLKNTVNEWLEDNAGKEAAALSFYTIFAIAPLLIISIAVAGAIFGEAAAKNEIVGQIQGMIGTEGARAVQSIIRNAGQKESGILASILGIGTLLLGATSVFVQLQNSLNNIWEVMPKPGRGIRGLIRDRFLSFAIVISTGFLLLVSLLISTALTTVNKTIVQQIPGSTIIWELVNIGMSIIVFTLIFGLIFKVVPDVKITWNDVLIGAFVTAILIEIGKNLIGLYLGRSSAGSTYGAAGSFVIILLWVYYSSQILFLGAEFTQVYARRYGKRIEPANYAMRVPKPG
jgi:membrane protein